MPHGYVQEAHWGTWVAHKSNAFQDTDSPNDEGEVGGDLEGEVKGDLS